MSRLEQLAKQRLSQRQDTASTKTNTNDNTKSVSLLDKLKSSKQGNTSAPKLSLAERLQKAKQSQQTKTESNSNSNTLSSKLHSLRNRNQTLKTQNADKEPSKESSERTIHETETAPIEPVLSPEVVGIKRILSIFESVVRGKGKSSSSITQPRYNDITIPIKKNESVTRSKRALENLHSVYIPPTKKISIQRNFNKPSPDDIAIEAQAQAFTEVTNKVSNLHIKPPKRLQKKSTPETKKERISMDQYMKTNSSLPTLSVVTLGHEGSGKSTIIGKLLYDLNIFNISTINDLKIRLERSQYKNDPYLFWSWLLDYDQKSSQVMEKDIRTKFVKYGRYNYRICDVPGNKAALNDNLFMTLSQADVGILTVDCGVDQFENGFNSNGQIVEHCILARTLGISRLIIAMNKLDTIDWYEERFMDIKRELQSFLTTIGFQEDQIDWIPCCGILNTKEDGIMRPVYNQMCPWNANSKSIVDILQDQSVVLGAHKKSMIEEESVISIDEITSKQFTGYVKSGNIQCDDVLNNVSDSQAYIIQKMWRDKDKLSVAVPGDYITINYETISEDGSEQSLAQRGDILTSIENQEIKFRPAGPLLLDIEMFPIDEGIVDLGSRWKAFINGQTYDIKVTKILDRQDNIMKVEVETTNPIIIFPRDNCIALRNKLNKTVGMGKLIS